MVTHSWQETVIGLGEKGKKLVENIISFHKNRKIEIGKIEIDAHEWKTSVLVSVAEKIRNLLLIIYLRTSKLSVDKENVRKMTKQFPFYHVQNQKFLQQTKKLERALDKIDLIKMLTQKDIDNFMNCWKWFLDTRHVCMVMIAYLINQAEEKSLRKDKKRLVTIIEQLKDSELSEGLEEPFDIDTINPRKIIITWLDAINDLASPCIKDKIYLLAVLSACIGITTGNEKRYILIGEFDIDDSGHFNRDALGGSVWNKKYHKKRGHKRYYKKYQTWICPFAVDVLEKWVVDRIAKGDTMNDPLIPNLKNQEGKFYTIHGKEILDRLGLESEHRGAYPYALRDMFNLSVKDVHPDSVEEDLYKTGIRFRLRDAHIEIAARIAMRQGVKSSWQGQMSGGGGTFFSDVNFKHYDRNIGSQGHRIIISKAMKFLEKPYRDNLDLYESEVVFPHLQRTKSITPMNSSLVSISNNAIDEKAFQQKLAAIKQKQDLFLELLKNPEASKAVGMSKYRIECEYGKLNEMYDELLPKPTGGDICGK